MRAAPRIAAQQVRGGGVGRALESLGVDGVGEAHHLHVALAVDLHHDEGRSAFEGQLGRRGVGRRGRRGFGLGRGSRDSVQQTVTGVQTNVQEQDGLGFGRASDIVQNSNNVNLLDQSTAVRRFRRGR